MWTELTGSQTYRYSTGRYNVTLAISPVCQYSHLAGTCEFWMSLFIRHGGTAIGWDKDLIPAHSTRVYFWREYCSSSIFSRLWRQRPSQQSNMLIFKIGWCRLPFPVFPLRCRQIRLAWRHRPSSDAQITTPGIAGREKPGCGFKSGTTGISPRVLVHYVI